MKYLRKPAYFIKEKNQWAYSHFYSVVESTSKLLSSGSSGRKGKLGTRSWKGKSEKAESPQSISRKELVPLPAPNNVDEVLRFGKKRKIHWK